ncbi:toll/interleukin-1 receptor domain-containing protein [Actinoalloteichus spitiensis]|uniref:toll/interleukin-1 receptor domain-containing protein n=1 Tax=Actinoalloteichus spitiensis TaxID=252394 RepID=UPI000584CBEA|nr:toll/interleukin-1 receptor domain-containing protein [Actinoalloteichus spitiensis]
MTRVFVNYRTGDEEMAATLIERELSRRFGSEVVFRDSKSIPPGADFEEALLSAVRSSEALLAVIGGRWLTAGSTAEGRAVDRDTDWTRREIVEAFRHDVRVVPVLVGGRTRLDREELPTELAPLVRCQYRTLDVRTANEDLARLADSLAEVLPGLAAAAPDSEPRPPATPSTTNTIGRVDGRAVQATHYQETYQAPVHTGSGPQFTAPQFHGDGTTYVAGDNHHGIVQHWGGRRREGRR